MRCTWTVPLLLAAACAPRVVGVQGGDLIAYNELTHKATKVYTAGSCRDRSGAPVSSPDEVEYELHQNGQKADLLEHALSEEQARLIRNSWQDGAGVHYFVWLKDVRGFEYVLPKEPGRPAQRRIYRTPQVREVKENGHVSTQPVGLPDVVCELLAMK